MAGGREALPGTAEAALKPHAAEPAAASPTKGWRTIRQARAADLGAENSSDSSEFGGLTTFTEEDLKGGGYAQLG